jgi:hypothetical protein
MASWAQTLEQHYSIFPEILRIFPDTLVLGVGFFSLITISFSYAVFFMSLLEALLVFYGLRSANEYLQIIDTPSSLKPTSMECKSGFADITMHTLSMFGAGAVSGFPSSALYITSVASSYIVSSMLSFSAEIQMMGQNTSSKFYTSLVSLMLLLLCIGLYRVYKTCDTGMNVIASAVIGSVIGALLVVQNTKLMGLSSLNLLGVPILKQRTAEGSTLYVCPS